MLIDIKNDLLNIGFQTYDERELFDQMCDYKNYQQNQIILFRVDQNGYAFKQIEITPENPNTYLELVESMEKLREKNPDA